MGRILTLPPSRWELDHLAGVALGVRYEAEHHALPDTPMWAMLERRYDLDPIRFQHWHPNVSLLIEHARQDGPGRPDVWPIDRCSPYQAGVGCEPPPSRGGAQQVVPEPPGLALALVAAIVGVGVMWRRAR